MSVSWVGAWVVLSKYGSFSSRKPKSLLASRYCAAARMGQKGTSPWAWSLAICAKGGCMYHCGHTPVASRWLANTSHKIVRAAAKSPRPSSHSRGPWHTSRTPQAAPPYCSSPWGALRWMPAQCSNHGSASARAAAGPSVSSRNGAGVCEIGSASRASSVSVPPMEKRICVAVLVVAVAHGKSPNWPIDST